jgi:hypothetical protein
MTAIGCKPGVGVVDHSPPAGAGPGGHITTWVVAPIVGVIGVAAVVLTGILVVRRRRLHRHDATALSRAEHREHGRLHDLLTGTVPPQTGQG